MNNRVFLAAIFIAVLATSAIYISPAAATPQRQNDAPTVLTIPTNNVSYEVNGTFYAWINVTSFSVILDVSGLPGLSYVNISIPEFYIGVRISVAVKNITFDVTDPEHPVVTGNVNVDASVSGRAKIYFNYTLDNSFYYEDTFSSHESGTWLGRSYIPWGTTTNFTTPFPVFDLNPREPNATQADANVGVKFTNENLTGTDTSWTVTHNTWDYSTWLQQRVNSTLNGFAGEAMANIQNAGIPGLQMGFTVPTSVGKVDLWKANAQKGSTTIPNVLLMASSLINLLVKYYVRGSGNVDVTWEGHHISGSYDVDIGADFGMFLSLIVVSSLGNKVLANYEINSFLIQVPENATLTWRKIGVIVYYGSPAHDCDVTGGESQGYWSYPDGEHKLFFVDYGIDGTPDFATNGTGQPIGVGHPAATVSGSSPKFTVQLDKSAGGWIYFSLQLPSGTNETDITVKRSDGVTVNATQYWITSNYLYVCDDPIYTYTVEIIGGGGGISPTTILIVGGVAIALVAVLAVVLMRKKGGKSNNVSIK